MLEVFLIPFIKMFICEVLLKLQFNLGSKEKAIAMATSSFVLESKDVTEECRIVDVVHTFDLGMCLSCLQFGLACRLIYNIL